MKPGLLLFLATCLSGSLFKVQAQEYSIDWFKVAGGSGVSTGNVYQVSGTIGQPDASQTMTGGRFSLTGGFWSLYAVQTPNAPLLNIRLTSTNTAQIYWASPSTGWRLQENANLAGPNWVTPSETVVDNGTIKYIIVQRPMGNKFYRLTAP